MILFIKIRFKYTMIQHILQTIVNKEVDILFYVILDFLLTLKLSFPRVSAPIKLHRLML